MSGWLPRLDGVILDLDGTLLDSMPLWHEIDLIFLRENGVEPPDNISDIVGKMSITEWAEYFIREFSIPHTTDYVIRRIEALAQEAYRNSIPLKPFVNPFLDLLDQHGLPYGIATATYKQSAHAALSRLQIADRMQFVLTGEDVPGGKTKPDIYLAAAERLGSAPARTLIVEDALHCIQTAVRAGFVAAGVYDASVPKGEWEQIQSLAALTGYDLKELMEKLQ